MASLYRLLRKGKWGTLGGAIVPALFGPETAADYFEVFDETGLSIEDFAKYAAQPGCIHVNIDSVSRDFLFPVMAGNRDFFDLKRSSVQITDADWASIPPCPAPFPRMWIEAPGRFAALVLQTQCADGFYLELFMFRGEEGCITGPVMAIRVALSMEGILQLPVEPFCPRRSNHPSMADALVVFHALARMNCKNATLRPILEGKSTPRFHGKPIPATVWHRIVISDVPRQQTTGRGALGRDETEMRCHWVRGHYADYRKNGLFGRPQSRGIYWIPAHRRGNLALGQVIPEYAFA